MKKGQVKVTIGQNGTPRIQEVIGDNIRVYTYEEWQVELESRQTKEEKAAESKETVSNGDNATEKPKKATSKKKSSKKKSA